MAVLKIKFVEPGAQDFYQSLKKRVDEYFTQNNLSIHANWLMILKTIFYLSVPLISYLLLLFGGFSVGINMLLFAITGLFVAFIGLNVCHDAIHRTYSKNQLVNKSLGAIFNIIGANDYLWNITHNIVHHTYTNIEGHDEDLVMAPIVRLSKDQPYMKIMRYQQYYTFFLYTLATLSWVFVKDYKNFFQKQIGNYENKQHPKKEYFNLFFYKIIHYILFIVIPFLLIDMSWWQILIGFVIMHLIEGFTLAIVFALAHLVEGPDFPTPEKDGTIHNNWAIHQLKTTANFCNANPVMGFFCGGLNFQIEHHLFPKVCHVHYPKIAPIVRQTAREYNIPYYEYPTFSKAVFSHFQLLKKLGEQE